MPSHGPKEPPDDDHGWEAEYDGLMATEEGQALLNGLWRLSSDAPDIGGHRTDLNDADAVETDDYALQAFVWMVYDRGIAYGYGQVMEEQGHAALAEELAEQDRADGAALGPGLAGRVDGLRRVMSLGSLVSEFEPIAKYVQGERHNVEPMTIPTTDILGNPTPNEPTPRPEHLRVNDSTCCCGDPECKLGEGWYF